MTVPTDWSRLSHRQLYEAVNTGPGRVVSVAAEEHWTRVEATVAAIERRISSALAHSNGGWEGVAADTTRTSVSPLGAWALDAAGDARLTAGAVLSQAEHAAELRRLLPPPATDPAPVRFAGRFGLLSQSPEVVAQQVAADADAKRLMHDYANHSYENEQYLDYWTIPPTVTVDSAPVGPAGAAVSPGAHGPGVGGIVGGPASHPGDTSAGLGGAGSVGGPGSGSGGVGSGGAVTGGAGLAGAGPNDTAQAGAAPTGPGSSGPGSVGAGSVGAGSGGPGGAAGFAPGGPVPGGIGSGGAGGYGSIPNDRGAGGAREPTAGGRGPSRATAPLGSTLLRPVVPEVPRTTPAPGWRNVLSGADPQVRTGEATGRATPAEEAVRQRGGGPAGMYPPMTGGGAGSGGGAHRRPGWLIDDTGAFDDNRRFPPAVITPDQLYST